MVRPGLLIPQHGGISLHANPLGMAGFDHLSQQIGAFEMWIRITSYNVCYTKLLRIWAALPGEGRISFFLDGSDIPVIEASLYELYSDLRRDYPHLVYRAGRSLNLFIPIPFRESCKIVADKDMGEFVHFGIRRFPEGTSLPAFSTGLMKKAHSFV